MNNNNLIKVNNNLDSVIEIESIFDKLNVNTRKSYLTSINQFLDYTGKGINELSAINYLDILNFIQNMKNSYCNATINVKIAALKTLFNTYSVITGALNPFSVIKSLKINTNQKTNYTFNKELSLSSQDIKTLLNHYVEKSYSNNDRTKYTSQRNYTLISLLYYHGLRISEALNIKTTDIKKQNNGVYTIDIIGKGNKPRIIIIDAVLYNDLMKLDNGGGLLFRALNNKQLSRIAISQDIKRLAKRLLKKDIHLHTFRHSFATNLIKATNNIESVSKYLGHSNLDITNKYYNHNQLTINELNLLKI
jgi:integrase/recombinase XerD